VTRDEAAHVILMRVLAREGGIKDIGDGKGETRFGQTPDWIRQFGFLPPYTADQALANYATWLVRTKLIGLCDYPDSLADVAVDFAVQSGHTIAIADLQRALGAKVDGLLGPETQAVVDACDRRVTAGALLAAKLRYRGQLITGNPIKFAQWAQGWLARDAAQVATLGAER
jgi:lysozyme family protein